jgi:hypothetical protein
MTFLPCKLIESVSGVTGATAQVNQETPPMRIYIIGNDGITLCREPPATVNKGDVAVAPPACRRWPDPIAS